MPATLRFCIFVFGTSSPNKTCYFSFFVTSSSAVCEFVAEMRGINKKVHAQLGVVPRHFAWEPRRIIIWRRPRLLGERVAICPSAGTWARHRQKLKPQVIARVCLCQYAKINVPCVVVRTMCCLRLTGLNYLISK